jgi:multiple sugar transport system substrate-binding protein
MSRRRPKVTRLSVVLLSMLVLLSLLAACGGAAAPTTGGDATTPEAAGGGDTTGDTGAATEATVAIEGPTAVTVKPTGVPEIACQPNQKELVWMVRNGPVENPWEANIVRPAFQKAKPEICLKILSIEQEDIAVKRQAMIASGEPLHVWSPNWGGDGFASDRVRGLLTDLTPLIQRDNFDTSVFIPEVLAIYQQEGKTWGLPFLTTGSYLYYNKKIFDDAGVAYPPTDWDDPNWTWQAFVDTAKKLTKNTDDINNAVFGANNGLWPAVDAIPFIWGHKLIPDEAHQTGFADRVEVVNDKTVQGFTEMRDLVHKYKVAPDPAASAALGQLGGGFESGRVAMQMTGGWGHWAYKPLIDDPSGFCWGAAPLPAGAPDAKTRATIFTDPWVITAKLQPEQQDMAWEFVKFLVSEEQARTYSQTTGTPPTQTKLLDEYYKLYEKCMKPEDMKKVFEGAFTHGRESSNHLLVRFDELNQIWDNNLSAIWDEPTSDVRSVLTDIESQYNDALSRIKAEGGQ